MKKQLDFYLNISYETLATHNCIKNVNAIFPDANIFIDRNQYFVYRPGDWVEPMGGNTNYPALNLETGVKLIKSINDAIQESTAEYMMILEPDVLILERPKTFPKGAGGILVNRLSAETIEGIERLYGFSQDRYSMAGGSVIEVEQWKRRFNGYDIEDAGLLFQAWHEILYSDALLSVVLWKSGIEIQDWEELCERFSSMERKLNASVVHGNKLFYNF